jgi:ribosomal protein S18 acetylase RimI-like enzyme
MRYRIRQMKVADYAKAHALWKKTEGLRMEESDSAQAVAIFLKRNRGFCFVACLGDRVVGTVLCGHDGRRGILRHLVVAKEHRKRGIAQALISRSLTALARAGIRKCNTFVLDTNVSGRRFWEHLGWCVLEDDYRTLQTRTMRGR